MTDKKAKEWANKNSCCLDGGECCANVTESFQAGYEQGYEDCRHYVHDYYKPKWHDLKKDPNDLPTEKGNYWVLDEDGDYSVFNVYVNELPLALFDNINAVAWCELSKFKE